MGFILNQGLHIHYEDLGKGNTLIMIHGLSSSMRHWINQHALAERYRIIMVDLRGHGISDSPRDLHQARIQDMASDIQALIHQLEIDKYCILGHSLGGIVALYHAIHHNPSGLILMDTFHKVSIPGFLLRFSGLVRLGGIMPTFLRKRWIKRALHNPSQELLQNLLAESARVNWRAVAMILRNLRGMDLSHQLHRIRCPTLIICGAEDRITPPRISIQMQKLIPNSRLELIPETGHCPAQESPERLNQLISEFLDQIFGDQH